MLELRAVTKRYGDTTVLGPVDLIAPRSRTTVLIGPSGSGKSTILRLMMGLVEPDEGHVVLESNTPVAGGDSAQHVRPGYVVQDGGLFPHLTAAENIRIAAEYFGWTPERLDARVGELCSLTRFPTDAIHRYPVELSGGQRQRVSLMRALMMHPPVLLLDEPLGALDPLIRAELQSDLREIFRELEMTVVMVTHDLREAAYFADHVTLLDGGVIAQEGTVDELVRSPASDFVARFVGAQRNPASLAPVTS